MSIATETVQDNIPQALTDALLAANRHVDYSRLARDVVATGVDPNLAAVHAVRLGVITESGVQFFLNMIAQHQPSATVHSIESARKARAKAQPSRAEPFSRGDHVELAERLAKQLESQGETVFADGDFYRYDSGIFRPLRLAELSRKVQKFAGMTIGRGEKSRALKLKASDVAGAVKLASASLDRDDFFSGAWPGVAFKGSFVSVSPSGIAVHAPSPEQRARVAYDFSFVQGAEPERFLRFLGEVFEGDQDAKEKVALLQESLGMAMVGRGTQMQLVPLLVGSGSNGKSTFAEIVDGCMPAGSVSAIAPQDLDNDYKRAALAGALLNLVSELPENEIVASEPWKAAIDGSRLSARSPYKDVFFYRPVAGHLYLANRLPGTTDQTGGFWRRWVVIEFNRRFTDDEKDTTLARKILATERPAVTAWLLEGARRALKQDRYTIPTSSTKAIARWRRCADQVAEYIAESWEPRPANDTAYTAWPKADWVYQCYRAWAQSNGHRPISSVKFGERMALLGHGSHKTKSHYAYPIQNPVAEVTKVT